jgi:DNA mismatch repair protein MutH
MRELRYISKILARRREGKRLFWIPKQRQENNIKMDLKWGVKIWIGFILQQTGTSGGFL